jgi:hypothetical protein
MANYQLCIYKNVFLSSICTNNKIINDLKRGKILKQSAAFLFSVSDEDIIYPVHRTGDWLIYRLLLAEVESTAAHQSNPNSC